MAVTSSYTITSPSSARRPASAFTRVPSSSFSSVVRPRTFSSSRIGTSEGYPAVYVTTRTVRVYASSASPATLSPGKMVTANRSLPHTFSRLSKCLS